MRRSSLHTLSSAPSRIEHVINRITSAWIRNNEDYNLINAYKKSKTRINGTYRVQILCFNIIVGFHDRTDNFHITDVHLAAVRDIFHWNSKSSQKTAQRCDSAWKCEPIVPTDWLVYCRKQMKSLKIDNQVLHADIILQKHEPLRPCPLISSAVK